jgi:plastocyanin
MRGQGTTIGLSLAVAVLAACSSSTAPNGGGGGGGGGGSSSTITIQSSGSGGYGGGTTYNFAPTPDTVTAGTAVSYVIPAGTQHNVHFDAVANAPDSIPASQNTTVNRTFTTAGTFNYHCSIHNLAGVGVVK